MSRRYGPPLLVLAALWGSSYLFIRVGVRQLSPAALIDLRLLCAAPLLVAYAVRRYGWAAVRGAWRAGIVLGVFNAALPFTLIAWGERHVDSGTAAVANSTVPIFVALLALWFAPSQRSTGWRLGGLALGLVGVAILAGVDPEGGWRGAVGIGAITIASISYAGANLYAGRRISVGGPVLAAASLPVAFVVLLPLSLTSLPAHAPGWKSLGSGVALGLLGTAVAQLLAYRMISLFGTARMVIVTYLMPAFALLYGSLLLGEPFTAQKLGGLVLVAAGVALGSGAVRLPRRTVPA